MDHKTFLSSLAPDQRRDLTARSDALGLAYLAGHWGLIVLLGALISAAVPLWPLLMLPLGVMLVFQFTLLHETSHKTPFRSSWINAVVGHICGFVLFLPANWFRYFHFAHHRFTQVPGKDPELAAPKPETPRQLAWHVSGLPVWRSQFATLFWVAAGRPPGGYVPGDKVAEVQREARLYLLGYGVLLAGSLWAGSALLLKVWLVPLLLGQPFLRLYLLAEHGRCPMVANMFENTRTTFTNALIRALAWNMPYHAEHHSYPSVPFHKLPLLHEAAKAHLRETSEGYVAFNREYLREMRE